MTEITVGTTTAPKIRFYQDTQPYDDTKAPDETLRMMEVPVTKRDWSVTDPEARAAEARKVLPDPDDKRWATDAQWYINADENAAALLVYRLVPQFP